MFSLPLVEFMEFDSFGMNVSTELRQALNAKKIANLGVLGKFDFEDLGWITSALPVTLTEQQRVLCVIELSGIWKNSGNATKHELRICAESYARSRETVRPQETTRSKPSLPPLSEAKRAKLAKMLGARPMSIEPREAVFKTAAAEIPASENSEFKNQALHSAALTMWAIFIELGEDGANWSDTPSSSRLRT